MKTLFLFTLIITCPSWSQDQSISILPRYGFSTDKFSMLTPDGSGNRYDYLYAQSLCDVGLNLDYNHTIWKRYKFYLTTGIDVSQSIHYQRIIEQKPGAHLDNIGLKKCRLGFHLGLMKRFSFVDDRLLLDIGGSLIYRQFFNETKNYSQGFKFNNESWIEYSYNLTTFHGKSYVNDQKTAYTGRFGIELSALLKFKLSDQLFLNFGLSYSTRNSFYYDYEYTIRHYTGGSLSSTYTNYGYLDKKFGINENYLYLNFGYTYLLKNRKE